MSEFVKELNAEEARAILGGQSTGLVVIDFWAPWCGPCVAFAPVFEQAASLASDITFAKLNVQDFREVAVEAGIRSIPTFFFFKDGEKVAQVVSAEQFPTAQKLVDYIKSL